MYKLLIVIFISLFFASCAGARPKNWYVKDVAMEKRKWRNCHESKDGPALHHKGICYISQKCYKKFFREKCKPVPLFCAWGDIECYSRNKWPEIKQGG